MKIFIALMICCFAATYAHADPPVIKVLQKEGGMWELMIVSHDTPTSISSVVVNHGNCQEDFKLPMTLPFGEWRFSFTTCHPLEVLINDVWRYDTSSTLGGQTQNSLNLVIGEYNHILVTSLSDDLVINGWTVNRGECPKQPPLRAFPLRLKFGDTTSFSPGGSCLAVETTFDTSLGVDTFSW